MNPVDHTADFFAKVLERLEAGEREYQNRSPALPLADLVRNIREELWDVAGWAVILDLRLAKIAKQLEELGREG